MHLLRKLLIGVIFQSIFYVNCASSNTASGYSGAVEIFDLPYSPSQRQFSLSIEEENHLGDVMFRVVPSADCGLTSFSRLDISPNCSGASYFVVANQATGDIRLTRTLDYEATQSLDLDVRAWLAPPQRGSNSSASSPGVPIAHALVGIQVININDHQPIFDSPIDTQTGDLHAEVAENAAPGTFVTKLHATDADQGEVGEVRYVIVGGTPGTSYDLVSAFGLEPVDGVLRVVNSSALDRESVRQVDLLVAAVDNPNHPNRQYAAISRLTIKVTDNNDKSPRFNASSFTVSSVCECAQSGSYVTQVTANDADHSSSDKLSYHLVDANVTFENYVPSNLRNTDARTLFTVDQNSGRITVSSNSLGGLIGNYSLLLEVADQGGLTNRTVVNFNVTSDNKFAPQFTISAADWTNAASVEENHSSDTKVFQVTASDRDTFGTNNKTEFYFYDPSTDSLVSQLSSSGFRISKDNGIIYSTRTFDAETDPLSFNVSVVARDCGVPPLQTNATLTIRIKDQDEYPPHWATSPSDGCNLQFNFWIPEKSPVGGRVGRVWSEDEDRTNRSYFRLEPRADAKYFSINPTTGVITIANPDDPSNAMWTTTPGQQIAANFLDYDNKDHRDFLVYASVSSITLLSDASSTTTASPNSGSSIPNNCLRGNVARVYIHLTNMEDDTPYFTRSPKPYYYCVAADAARNTLVSTMPQIMANDVDGSKLTFRMSSSEWRSSTGFISVSCAFRMEQPSVLLPQAMPSMSQLVVNSALGNYSRSYFRIPIDVRDQGGLSSSSTAFVWVVPSDSSCTASGQHLIQETTSIAIQSSSMTTSSVIQPTPPADSNPYYAKVTVVQNYDQFMTQVDQWVDCVSNRLFAGDRYFAGAPLCIASIAPDKNDPNGQTEVRVAAASNVDMLLTPAVLFVASLQQHINASGGGMCGVIRANCSCCGSGAITGPLVSKIIAKEPDGGFDPLALLIALACLLLFLILLLLILLAVCCRPRRKGPILVPAPPARKVDVPIYTVKPARLYETQEAYMSVEDQLQVVDRGFEEQEICLEENDDEEVFEIALPREYETQTVLLEVPTWANGKGKYGRDNPTLILDHGIGESQQIPLTHQHGARHLSGSVYSEPYFRSTHTEQRAFSMLHIDTRPSMRQHASQRRLASGAPTAELSPQASSGPGSRLFATLPPLEVSPPTINATEVGGHLSRSATARTPSMSNLQGGISHIACRIGENSRTQVQQQQQHQQQQQQQQQHLRYRLDSPQRPPGQGGLLRPAISAESITLTSEQQQARRAVLHQHQQQAHETELLVTAGFRTDESEPSDSDNTLRRHIMAAEAEAAAAAAAASASGNRGGGRIRRTRSLPKYLQPPAELQSVIAELHDYIKSPEQKARRRRISEKYRAKLLASGVNGAAGNQAETTSSSDDSSYTQQLQQQQQRRQRSNEEQSVGRGYMQHDYMML